MPMQASMVLMAKLSFDIEASLALHSDVFRLPINLVKAICQIESSFNPWAFRYEPAYKYILGDKLTMTDTERFGQKCSWGLMQVMGGVARELDYQGPFPQLCEPDIGVRYGCRHLAKFYCRWPNWEDAIASYNAGAPRKLATGEYYNQHYVNKVQAAWKAFDFVERNV
jgi:hypothetical protein